MNKILRNVLIIASVLAIITLLLSQFLQKETTQLSPQDKIEFTNSGLEINMVYCQPFKKGRVIFGSSDDGALQVYGKYWRLGANEATTIETNKDLMIGNNKLAKGAYSIYAIPGQKTWKLGFNSVANRWGASEPDYTKDLFIVEVPANYSQDIKEQFTITINNNSIEFWWDTSKITLPYKVAE